MGANERAPFIAKDIEQLAATFYVTWHDPTWHHYYEIYQLLQLGLKLEEAAPAVLGPFDSPPRELIIFLIEISKNPPVPKQAGAQQNPNSMNGGEWVKVG